MVGRLLFEVAHDMDTSLSELKIHSDFTRFINDPDLLNLPLAVVNRLINIEVLMDFLMKCLDKFGCTHLFSSGKLIVAGSRLKGSIGWRETIDSIGPVWATIGRRRSVILHRRVFGRLGRSTD
jgi:hypothetical protein